MSRIFFLETELKAIRRHAAGASRMTRRLAYICELADAALEGRPLNVDIKEPRDRAVQWQSSLHPPVHDGYYPIRTCTKSQKAGIAYWNGEWWDIGLVSFQYLTFRIPMEKK